jgi:hypothetical protein
MDIYTAITATSTVVFVRQEATKKLLACMTVKEVPGKHIQSTTMLRTSMVGSTYKCIVEFESSHACIPIHACTGWLCMEVQNKATTEGEEKGPAGMNMRIRVGLAQEAQDDERTGCFDVAGCVTCTRT